MAPIKRLSKPKYRLYVDGVPKRLYSFGADAHYEALSLRKIGKKAEVRMEYPKAK